MASVRFVLPGPPQGKATPVVTRNGTFIPAKSRAEMDALRAIARIAMAGRDPFEGAVHLKMAMYMPIQKSWPKWKREAARRNEIYPITLLPDASNCQKLVEDAIHAPPQQRAGRSAMDTLSPTVRESLRMVVIWDDKQIVRWEGWKLFSDNPRIVVEVSEMPPKIVTRKRNNACVAVRNGTNLIEA